MDERLYPPPPARLPSGYLALPLGYRLHVIGMGLAILAFAAVYAACLAGTALALGWVAMHVPPTDLPIILFLGWVGALVALGLVLLFLLKGLLIRQTRPREQWIELLPAREPVFFAFLARLATEVRAPVPRRVFLSPGVEAAVFQDTTLISLIWPPRKQLVVGLGLVSSLDLRELKAVLAHELGHFSQSSMRIGGYVYFAKMILAELVDGRDAIDVAIDELRFARRRELAMVGWTAYGLVAAMRTVLRVMYRTVLLSDLALSREMELNADRVAISAAGSAALVTSLGRAAFGDACLAHASAELAHAADHELHTSDLYAHQLRAAETLPDAAFRPEWSRLDEELDPERPPIFSQVDDARPSMWATHPPSWMREAQARRTWIDAPRLESDQRPAWALFGDAEGLRQRMTMQLARATHSDRALRFTDAEKVETFLAQERESAKLDARYHGAYGQRLLALIDIDAVLERAGQRVASRPELESEWDALYGPELAAHVRRVEQHVADLEALTRAGIDAAREGRSTFAHRGFPRPVGDIRSITQPIETELERETAWRDAWDARVAATHARLALDLDAETADELRERYVFHGAIQALRAEALGARALLVPALAVAGSSVAVAPHEEERAMRYALEARSILASVLERAAALRIVTLPGLLLERGLARFLLPVAVISDPRLMGDTVEKELVLSLARQQGDVLDRLERVRKKSLSALLALQERIAERWRARST